MCLPLGQVDPRGWVVALRAFGTPIRQAFRGATQTGFLGHHVGGGAFTGFFRHAWKLSRSKRSRPIYRTHRPNSSKEATLAQTPPWRLRRRPRIPPDINSLLSVADHCLHTENYMNVIVKQTNVSERQLSLEPPKALRRPTRESSTDLSLLSKATAARVTLPRHN